jgi:hypothetical protein
MSDPVMIEVHPTETPAADLPNAMWMDVCDVLHVHGLRVKDVPVGLGLVAVAQALVPIIDAVPVEYGGRAGAEQVPGTPSIKSVPEVHP